MGVGLRAGEEARERPLAPPEEDEEREEAGFEEERGLPPSMRDQVGPEAVVCLPAGFLAAEEWGIVGLALQCGCGRGCHAQQ
jgi:hypothetical protein